MSDKLMDTSPGGETPQYESIDTDTKGHAKLGGQLSGIETTEPTTTDPLTASTHHDATRGEKTAENIRFGQAISEEGVGGFTTNNSETAGLGESDAAADIRGGVGSGSGGGSSYGGAGAAEQDEQAVKARRAQGYGGDADADRSIGA